MNPLNKRVDKLETANRIGAGRLIVVAAAYNTPGRKIESVTGKTSENDLVIIINRFGTSNSELPTLLRMGQ